MNEEATARKLAVLIDAENARPATLEPLLGEIAKYGVASVKRAYGDWTTTNLKGWKETLLEHAIQPMQQFRYTSGKNATDSALIIDAMDLLVTGRFDGFCLVSSDSDFTRLASRLREAGLLVLGFGERKTPQAFVSSCDKFVYTDILLKDQGASAAKKGAVDLRADQKLVGLLRRAVDDCADDEGWANLGTVGQNISNQSPDFDPRLWGFKKLVDLVTATSMFEVVRRPTAAGGANILVRRRKGA